MKRTLLSPWLRTLFSVCSLVILLTLGCHKNKEDTSPPIDPSVAAYLHLPDGADQRLSLLLKQIEAVEVKEPFIASIVQQYGKPVWDKGIIGERGTTILYAIPLIPDSKYLSGAIVFELGDQLRFKVYENRDFLRYGTSSQRGAVNGRKVRNLMMALNFRYPPPDDPNNPQPPPPDDCVNSVREAAMLAEARAANPGKELHLQHKMIAVTTCYSWTTCTGDGNGNCVGQIYYHEECVTDTYWLPDGGGGGGGGGGDAGGGGGGGGGTSPNPNPDPCPGIEDPDPAPVPVAEADVLAPPCASSFNMVRQDSWQSAVVTGYRFGLFNRSGNGLDYYIEIGTMEVGLPYIAYNGNIIHHSTAQAMITQAATLAEGEVLAVLNASLILNPGTQPGQIDNGHYKRLFKEALKTNLDLFLKLDYYDGQNVKPSRVGYDPSAFGLKDATKYRPFKYKGRDC